MGHDHLQNAASSAHKYPLNVPTSDTSWPCLRLAWRKRKTRALRRTFYTLGIFLFSPICNPCSPLVYKGEGRAPHWEGDQRDRLLTDELIESSVRLTYTAKPPPGSWPPFDPSIRDLGPVPLLTVYTPYYKPLLVLITRAATDWT